MRIKHLNISAGSQVFKCLSEIPRLRILNLLLDGTILTITDLELILEYTQAKTSRHITYLKNVGLLSSNRIDHWTFYSLNDEWGEIMRRYLKTLEKDTQLNKDKETFEILNSNRELSQNKLAPSKFKELGL